MKSVAVIGAGQSGLAAIKSCLEEGFKVVCYELTSHVGGVWRYRDEVDEDTVSVFRSVFLNVSKEIMAYSDFPPPLEFPTYPRHYDWHKYFESYCEHFDLKKHIKFNHKVLEVVKAEDYDSTGRWKVTVSDVPDGKRKQTTNFDFVLVCSGHHVHPIIPKFPGLEDFEGKVIHSKVYREPSPFQKQKVLIVGFGNSSPDIANDLCSSTKQIYLSARHKAWIFPRLLKGNQITDNELFRPSFQFLYRFLPVSWLIAKYEGMVNNTVDHEFFGLKPKHNIAAQRLVVNDFLPLNLLNGGIQLKPGIKKFQKKGVIFDKDNELIEIDSVILATGYQCFYPYLKGMEYLDHYVDRMYKLILPADLSHNTLGFIGMIDSNISTQVCAELQARWVSGVFSGKVHLPSKEIMMEEARKAQEQLKLATYEGFKQNTNIVNGPGYLMELASMLGVKPNLIQILLRDPKLFCGLFFGPFISYQFRLQGPHVWQGAREAILGAEQRASYQLSKSRDTTSQRKISNCVLFVCAFICLIIAVLLFNTT